MDIVHATAQVYMYIYTYMAFITVQTDKACRRLKIMYQYACAYAPSSHVPPLSSQDAKSSSRFHMMSNGAWQPHEHIDVATPSVFCFSVLDRQISNRQVARILSVHKVGGRTKAKTLTIPSRQREVVEGDGGVGGGGSQQPLPLS